MKYKTRCFLLLIMAGLIHPSFAQSSYDSVSFEVATTEIVIDTTAGNLWQIGTPQKTVFDSAHSGTKAMLTDTLNDYPPNDTSSFTYIIRNPYTQTCRTCMEFWHRYDMDSIGDQGNIEASYDGGDSWLLLKDTFNVQTSGSYFQWEPDFYSINGKLSPHKLITSGVSDGWIKSTVCWQWFFGVTIDTIILMPDSLMIRFTFISDSIENNQEGWMIDDIVTSTGPEDCSGIEENQTREKVSIYPNPYSTSTTLKTDLDLKNATLTLFNLYGQPVKQILHIFGYTVTWQRDQLSGGIYFLRLTEGNKIITIEKVVISADGK